MLVNRPSLPQTARLPINRCNLPATILGSLTFQQHPAQLQLDGIDILYKGVFEHLDQLPSQQQRAADFMQTMSAQFLLESPQEMGLENRSRIDRSRATYLRLIRGWFFDSDSIEGAVMKGWVESRFGLIPRFHVMPIRDPNSGDYLNYIQEWASGLYNTNALETQLDLLYSYCQYELAKQFPGQTHLTLYRGFSRLNHYEIFDRQPNGKATLLLNNINSFSVNRERADEFGDYVIEVKVPLSKIVFYNSLLPRMLSSEEEYVVLGGLYEVKLMN